LKTRLQRAFLEDAFPAELFLSPRSKAIHGFVRSLGLGGGNKRDHVELSATLRDTHVSGATDGLMLSLRSALFAAAVLVGGAVLILVGGFGAILFLTNRQCDASGYLCEAPTANIRDEKDHADPRPPEPRFGWRYVTRALRSDTWIR
jgi:hypothetical protein